MTARAQPAAATSEKILFRGDADGVASLTMNRPAARNALSADLMTALQGELDAIAKDAAIKMVVIAANGTAFCSGHDLREMRANPGRLFHERLFAQCSALMQAIVRLPKPLIVPPP